MAIICSAGALALFAAGQAGAQGNPFLPPQSGMSRSQIQEIVRQEVIRAKAGQVQTPGTPSPAGAPGAPGGGVQSQMRQDPGVAALPGQTGGGGPVNTASGGGASAAKADDPVADLLTDGGIFVGCVGGTPVFKDRTGRRAYFTTRELRESNEARRFTRCG